MGDEALGRDWLLLLIAAGGQDAQIDPIRVMKGAFLLTQQLLAHDEPKAYEFIPYDYGPCAFEVYRDLDLLAMEGLISADMTPRRKWPTYRPTAAGAKRAKVLSGVVGDEWAEYMRELRAWLDRRTFQSLLRYIYTKYPDYASKSVLPDLAKQP